MTYQRQDTRWIGREKITDGNNEQQVSVVFSYYDRNVGQWGKKRWIRTIRNTVRRGVSESLLEESLQFGANKWQKGLFEGHGEDMEEDHIHLEQTWRSTTPDKWDTIVSGNWIQKAVWNRMVTTSELDHLHKTPVTSTWTTDFSTREGEGHKAMGDWLVTQTVHWKTLRRLLQTNVVTFPCEGRLQKWDNHPDGICDLFKHNREMDLKLIGGRHTLGTTGHLQSSVCRLQNPVVTGDHNVYFQQVQDDMNKTQSVDKDWEFVSGWRHNRDLGDYKGGGDKEGQEEQE